MSFLIVVLHEYLLLIQKRSFLLVCKVRALSGNASGPFPFLTEVYFHLQ